MSIDDGKKRHRGRPLADTDRVEVRMAQSILQEIDDWRAQQLDKPNRPEAIRRLLLVALKAER